VILFLNVHAPTKGKSDDAKHSCYEELERVLDHFPKYHMNSFLGNFNTKVGRKICSNQQKGMTVCMKLVMIMEFE
jgi:hypothetical protein